MGISVNQLKKKNNLTNINPYSAVAVEIQVQMQDWHLVCIFAVLKHSGKKQQYSPVSYLPVNRALCLKYLLNDQEFLTAHIFHSSHHLRRLVYC